MNIRIGDPNFKEKTKIIASLYNVIDPELFVNIIDLGLVYDIAFPDPDSILITMTLSTPHCPLGEAIQEGVKNALHLIYPDKGISISIVWEPKWNMDMITEEGKRQLQIL